MHPTVCRRLLWALLGFWFSAYAAEPPALVACPMHGAAGAVAAKPGHASAPEASHQAHHGGAGAAETPIRPEHQGAHLCTCIGHCVGATVALLQAPGGPPVSVPVVATTDASVTRGGDRPATAAAYTLPFATAPPAV